MEKIYKFTKNELIEAFRKWDADWLQNPKEYRDIQKGSEVFQAEVLIEYLTEKGA